MEYTNLSNEIVFLKDADIASYMLEDAARTISGNIIEKNGIPSYDLFKSVHDSVSSDIKFLSGELSTVIRRDLSGMRYFGDVYLSDEYYTEQGLENNTLYGLIRTNKYIKDPAKEIIAGFVFRTDGNPLSIYSVSSDNATMTQTLLNNEYLFINKNLNALSNISLSDINIIKDYDLSVSELQKYTVSKVTVLSSELSNVVKVKELSSPRISTVEQIADEYGCKWNVDDIIIVKNRFGSDAELSTLFEHTGYVYDGAQWKAMDGNYSAENVYIPSDLSMDGEYQAVGNFKKSESPIRSKGKSMQWLLENMFDTTINPTRGAEPTWSFALHSDSNKTFEVGATHKPKFTIGFTKGKYNYPWIPQTVNDSTYLSSVVVQKSDDPTVLSTYNLTGTYDNLTEISITNDLKYQLKALNAKYAAGDFIPVNSKGKQCPDVTRPAGSFTNEKIVGTIKGSYYCFYGYKTKGNTFKTYVDKSIIKLDLSKLTIDDIRELNFKKFISDTINNTVFETEKDTMQFIVACPKDKFNTISIKQDEPPTTIALEAIQNFELVDGGGNTVGYTLFSSTANDPADKHKYTILTT